MKENGWASNFNVTLTNYEDDDTRDERLILILGALAFVLEKSEIDNLVWMHDHKGVLGTVWRKPPSPSVQQIVFAVWEKVGCDCQVSFEVVGSDFWAGGEHISCRVQDKFDIV